MNEDSLFSEAVKTVCQYDRASASLLQRKLSIGYARAARLLDSLAENGIVSKPDGSKPVDVLVRNADDGIARLQQNKLFPPNSDPLLDSAVRLTIGAQKCSASFLQSKLDVGYARSARMVDQLEDLGVIGPATDKDPRKVNFQNYDSFIDTLKKVAPKPDTTDDLIKLHAMVIEKTLESFNITARVAEVKKRKYAVDYNLEIALGTKLDDLTKRRKDLALAVASPSGDIYIEAPIPGRSLVRVTVPNQINDNSSKFLTLVGSLILLVADWINYFGLKILYRPGNKID